MSPVNTLQGVTVPPSRACVRTQWAGSWKVLRPVSYCSTGGGGAGEEDDVGDGGGAPGQCPHWERTVVCYGRGRRVRHWREDIPVLQGGEGGDDSLAPLFTLYLTCFQEGFEELIITAPGASACRDGRDRVSAGAWLGRGWLRLAGPGPAPPEGWRRADFRGGRGGGFWG